MPFDPDRHHRRSIRLKGYDYSQAGAYFITICTYGRELVLGDLVDAETQPSEAGRLVEQTWDALPARFRGTDLDAFVVMPNHIHGIILIGVDPDEPVGAGLAPPTARRPPTLGEVVGAFKSISAIGSNRLLGRAGQPFWQRNFHEHVIRKEIALEKIRRYIDANAANWAMDPDNPHNQALPA